MQGGGALATGRQGRVTSPYIRLCLLVSPAVDRAYNRPWPTTCTYTSSGPPMWPVVLFFPPVRARSQILNIYDCPQVCAEGVWQLLEPVMAVEVNSPVEFSSQVYALVSGRCATATATARAMEPQLLQVNQTTA